MNFKKLLIISLVTALLLTGTVFTAFAEEDTNPRDPDWLPDGLDLIGYACLFDRNAGETWNLPLVWSAGDGLHEPSLEDMQDWLRDIVDGIEDIDYIKRGRCQDAPAASFDFTAGSEVTAFLGACTINSQAAFVDGSITLTKYSKDSVEARGALYKDACRTRYDGSLGAYTFLSFVLDRESYNRYMNDKLDLVYSTDGTSWMSCNPTLTDNGEYGQLGCWVTGNVWGFGLGNK